MADGSISRMSASWSRISSKTCLRSSGPFSTWVSAGTASPVSRGHLFEVGAESPQVRGLTPRTLTTPRRHDLQEHGLSGAHPMGCGAAT